MWTLIIIIIIIFNLVKQGDVKSLDFAVTRFLMKLFKSANIDLINECRYTLYYLFQLFARKVLEKIKR